LVTELAVSTQAREHWVNPVGQLAVQLPLTQAWAGAHAVPQLPQWLGSELRSVQVPLQFAVLGQPWAQLPSAQAVPP
jgi:uncharacterized membrane protein